MKRQDYQRLLGLSARWLRLGLLTEKGLCALGDEYEASEDKSTEHYRYRVFREYLDSHWPLPAQMAEALYELGKDDPDRTMGGAMMRDVLDLAECPPQVLRQASASGERHLVRAVGQKRLLAELRSGLTAELFARCLASRDSVVQRELLARPELSRGQLEELAESGSSRAVRNMAAERLRARRYAA
jgi:hypothetical protein